MALAKKSSQQSWMFRCVSANHCKIVLTLIIFKVITVANGFRVNYVFRDNYIVYRVLMNVTRSILLLSAFLNIILGCRRGGGGGGEKI